MRVRSTLSGSRFEGSSRSTSARWPESRASAVPAREAAFTDLSTVFEDAEPDEDVELLDPDESPSEQQTSGKVTIQLADMDLPSWERDLKADLDVIEALLG